jgi:thymidylate synthase ThyX
MIETFTDSERAALAPYVTNLDSPIFALRNLPEEVIAVLFAYYSRSRESLRRNLLKLLEEGDLDLTGDSGAVTMQMTDADDDRLAKAREKAKAFHEKWVVGYGHSSVAEHGCVHLALENVSIIASKLIEDCRLASYTEKSTRYVAFDAGKMYYPPELQSNPVYVDTIKALLDAYTGWTEDIVAQIKARVPRTEKQTERGYDTACRASAFDILRYLLPSATYTNIGLTLNARSLETMITKLLSQPLPEGRAIGEAIKREAQHIVPTLLKYADHNAYRDETDAAIAQFARIAAPSPLRGRLDRAVYLGGGSAVMAHADPDADNRLVAAILYGYVEQSAEELLATVKQMDQPAKEKIVDDYLCRRGKHDAPGRALERIFCTIEMTMDYGAYRDIQRHRMATQTTQGPSPYFGFAMPPEIERFGYADQYNKLMDRCANAYESLVRAGFDREAAYVLPLATRMRALFTWNLREVTHFVELRSSRQGHPSYRHVAQEVYRAVEQAFPLIARYIRPNMKNYDLTRD